MCQPDYILGVQYLLELPSYIASVVSVFDEDFVFEVRPAALGRRTLEVILYDFDAYSRHHSIGGVKIPLANIDLSDKVALWKGLGPCSEQDSKVGTRSPEREGESVRR